MIFLKIIMIAICSIIFHVVIWIISTLILTEINPNYEVLENGERGYYMNTGNMFLAFLIALTITVLALNFLRVKFKKHKEQIHS